MNIGKSLQRLRPILARTLIWARRLFLPIALGFLAYSAYRASSSLLPLVSTVSVLHLVMACLCWIIAQWVGPLATTALAHAFNIQLGYRKLALISILRIPAKYLPGGIWQSVARFVAYREHAAKNSDPFFMLLIEHLIALGASTTLGSLLLLEAQGSVPGRNIAGWLLGAGILLLAASTAWALRIKPLKHEKFTSLLLTIASTLVFWCLASTAFLLYWTALFGMNPAEIPALASGYLLSWAAGFAAVFAPQGVGVFEWTAAHLLPTSLPINATITALAGFRIITIIGDLLAWLSGIVISRHMPPRQPSRRVDTSDS